MKTIDESGKRYGMLVVLEFHGINANRCACWLCQCDCGKQAVIAGRSLRQKRNPTKSCGCLAHAEVTRMARGLSRATHAKEQRSNQRKFGSSMEDYLSYQAGLQFIEALLGPRLRTHA